MGHFADESTDCAAADNKHGNRILFNLVCRFLARDAFVANRRAIAMMFVRLSVCLGWVCIVTIRCTTLARI